MRFFRLVIGSPFLVAGYVFLGIGVMLAGFQNGKKLVDALRKVTHKLP